MDPRKVVGSKPEDKPDSKPADGGFQAMDQMANWVRFADAKATILTAGLGVVLTMLMTNSRTVVLAIKRGSPDAYIVGPLALVSLLAFGYTLFWLVRAIGPQKDVPYTALNRFAWPSLTSATMEQLTAHAQAVDVRLDAWQQVIDLSVIAGRKFDACARAIRGFAVLIVAGAACVGMAISLTA